MDKSTESNNTANPRESNKSNSLAVIVAIIIITVITGTLYMLYKTWMIFGFWNIVLTGFMLTSSFDLIFSSRTQKNGIVTYNPKEWTKFINIGFALGAGYFLYDILINSETSETDYILGITYILIVSILPSIFSLYKLLRDRNDYISLSDKVISYRDNKEQVELEISSIEKVEMKDGILLTLKDGSSYHIRTNSMNFNKKDLLQAYSEIESLVPVISSQKNIESESNS
jgi:carbon starvation protein CstA